MKLIKLTIPGSLLNGNVEIHLNVEMIGDIYIKKDELGKKFTTVGCLTHPNGFKVLETPDEIIEKIRTAESI